MTRRRCARVPSRGRIRPSARDADRGRRLRSHDEHRRRWRASAFGDWNGAARRDAAIASAAARAALPPVAAAQRRAAAGRAAVRAAHRPRRASRATRPTTTRWSLPNMVLGGQFVSRINLNLREDKGFTYGARTAFDFRRGPGPFALQASVQTGGDGDGDRGSRSARSPAIRGARPVTRRGARARRRRAHARLRAQLRDRRADRARRRRSLRSTTCPTTTSSSSCRDRARDADEVTRRRWRATSIPRVYDARRRRSRRRSAPTWERCARRPGDRDTVWVVSTDSRPSTSAV